MDANRRAHARARGSHIVTVREWVHENAQEPVHATPAAGPQTTDAIELEMRPSANEAVPNPDTSLRVC